MRLLFEGHKYSQTQLKPYIEGLKLDNIKIKKNAVSLSYVGYFFCDTEGINDIVFILPKVFIYNEKYESEPDEDTEETTDNKGTEKKKTKYLAFGKYEPEDIIEPESKLFNNDEDGNGKYYHDYIYKLSAWLYQTIKRYDDRVDDNDNCVRDVSHSITRRKGTSRNLTLMDHIFSLKKFVKENPAFFTFVLKNAHTGYNKIKWEKTIRKQQPAIIDNAPLYIDVNNKRRSINDEEELLVILFSTLKDINKTYGIPVTINEQFKQMSKLELKQFKASACKKLKSLKYKYFSDKALELWGLLYDFYGQNDTASNTHKTKDMLLVKSFNPVFEDMIDYLLSDDNYPSELKDQFDGKFIDHIYKDKSLVYDDDLFYVGDSKYYKEDRKLEDKSVAKQYTYAKNIIQRNIDVIKGYTSAFGKNNAVKEDYVDYRDDLTEGYNVTPNFFISGQLFRADDKKIDDKNLHLEKMVGGTKENGMSQHFPNRLFDRDTLLLQRYNINFLYVLFIYARKAESKRRDARVKARNLFKKDIQSRLNNNYAFYHFTEIENKEEIEKFLDRNFRKVNGKVFSFRENENSEKRYLLLALEEKANSEAHDVKKNELAVNNNITIGLDKEYKVERVFLKENGNPMPAIVEEIVNEETKEEESNSQETPHWRIVSTIDENLKFEMYLPLYTAKAACGAYNLQTEIDFDSVVYWIEIPESYGRITKEMFVVKAEGDSMEPKIHDGNYCIFKWYNPNAAGSKEGEIVLAEQLDKGSEDDRYVIKKYHAIKEYNEEYNNFRIETQVGNFVSQVREEYINLLNDIAAKCCIKKNHIYEQTTRLTKYIKNKYNGSRHID